MPNPTATALHGRGVLDIDAGEVIELPELTLLPGDPLAEIERVQFVMKDGKVYNR